ncbi:MAG: choice-of-anchor Q domain-containing protein [bacterium]
MRFLRFPLFLFLFISVLGFSSNSYSASFTVNVDDNTDTVHAAGCATDGTTAPCSLRDACIFANTKTGADDTTITLQATTYILTISGSSNDDCQTGDLDFVGENVTINGVGQTSTFIQASPDAVTPPIDRVIQTLIGGMGTATNLTLNNLTIRYGHDPDGGAGGGIDVQDGGFGSTLTLMNVTVTQNSTDFQGGGVELGNGSTGTFTNSIIDVNVSNGQGGGVLISDNAKLNLNNSSVSGNKANDDGGGILCGLQGTLISDHSHIDNNTADNDGNLSGDGGGIAGFGGDGECNMTVKNGSTVNGNQSQNGGGIFNSGLALVDNSVINNNKAMADNMVPQQGGGGVFNGGILFINNESTLDGNQAVNANGGGIYHTRRSFQSALVIVNTTISRNTAFDDGGGIYRDNPMILGNVTISTNTATNGEGGGIYNNGNQGCGSPPCLGTLIHVTVANNTAPTTGGISATDVNIPVDLKNTIIAGNQNGNCGGTFFTSLNHNLRDDDTCDAFLTGPNDLKANAQLGSLQDNGGTLALHPQTHALAFSSPAVDAVPVADCTDTSTPPNPITFDERGFPRPAPAGGSCDIGAFELQPMAALTVDPIALNFISTVGVTTAPQTITVTSTGNVPATVTSAVLGGTNSALFAISQDNCSGKTLNPTETCTVLVTFTPNAVGTFTGATVVFASSNAPINPTDTVTLTGVATAPPAPPGLIVEGSGCLSNLAGTSPSGSAFGSMVVFSPVVFGWVLRRRKR